MHYKTSGRDWVLESQEDWIRFFTYAAEHPEDEDAQWLMNQVTTNQLPSTISTWYEDWHRTNQALEGANQSGDYSQLYKDLTQSGTTIDPNLEKYIDNSMARQNTEEARNFEEYMRDTNITSSASQYAAAGLSPSSVIHGISAGNSVAAADNAFGSRAVDRQQLSMQKYQTNMGIARGILSMVSQMASSGIYGSAIGSAKMAAGKITAAAAHSGLQALQNMRPEMRQQMMLDAAARGEKLY